ncbi:MAG: hypothetical protein ACREKE_00100 [bacterium]
MASKRWSCALYFAGLALLGLLATACAPRYQAVDSPSTPLSQFGHISLGHFTTSDFLDSIKGTPRYEKYLLPTADANSAVYEAVKSRLNKVRLTQGGPRLLLSADMENFSTGSGATRALAMFGLVPSGVGQGIVEYQVDLTSKGQRVATYTVRRPIKGGAKGAYDALGSDIVQFLVDHQSHE